MIITDEAITVSGEGEGERWRRKEGELKGEWGHCDHHRRGKTRMTQ